MVRNLFDSDYGYGGSDYGYGGGRQGPRGVGKGIELQIYIITSLSIYLSIFIIFLSLFYHLHIIQ